METGKKTLISDSQSAYNSLVSGNCLDSAEAGNLLEGMLCGELDGIKTAAALTILHSRKETPDELKGFVDALRKRVEGLPMPSGDLLDNCGTGGDGHGTINISTTAMFVAAAAGVRVAKHGNRAMSGKSGAADVLERLGVRIDTDAETVKACVESCGIGFYFAPAFHEAMKVVGPVRRALGFRTIFNLAGPLANPSSPNRQLVGVYDASVMETVAKAMVSLSVERGMVVHGADGMDELSISTETKVLEIANGQIISRLVAPEDYGFKRFPLDTIRGGDAEYNAIRLIKILSNQGNEGEIAAIALNAGAAIYIHGLADTLEKGVSKALEIIREGKGFQKLVDLRMMSNGAKLDDRLSRIVHAKQLRLMVKKFEFPPEEMKARAVKETDAVRKSHASRAGETSESREKHMGFEAVLRSSQVNHGGIPIHVIAESKKASPSKGLIRESYDPVAIGMSYEMYGASAMSVLTEEDFFKGSPMHLEEVGKRVGLPLLRKDFIIDPYQIHEAKILGASAILLIVALLDKSTLQGFMAEAKSLGMDVLVEVHDDEEIRIALDAGASIIGINNRNLRTFEVTLETSLNLVGMLPPHVVAVSESGISTTEEVRRLAHAGFSAILVGEQFMRQACPGMGLKTLLNGALVTGDELVPRDGMGIVKCCGLRRPEDIAMVNSAKPDYAGFVLAPGKRQVDMITLKKLIERLDPAIRPVGVFVDPALQSVLDAVDAGIQVVQLHGREDSDAVNHIRTVLDGKGHAGVSLWKAHRFNSEASDEEHLNTLHALLDHPAIEHVLVDAFEPGTDGGTGTSFDWERLNALGMMDRIILAGGLNGNNVNGAVTTFSPYGVDASSGMEVDGFKEKGRVESFVGEARRGFLNRCDKMMKKATIL